VYLGANGIKLACFNYNYFALRLIPNKSDNFVNCFNRDHNEFKELYIHVEPCNCGAVILIASMRVEFTKCNIAERSIKQFALII